MERALPVLTRVDRSRSRRLGIAMVGAFLPYPVWAAAAISGADTSASDSFEAYFAAFAVAVMICVGCAILFILDAQHNSELDRSQRRRWTLSLLVVPQLCAVYWWRYVRRPTGVQPRAAVD